MYVNLEGGKKAAMPRYYKDKIYNHEERSEVSGYQKGEMEKRFYEYCKADPHYGRNRSESVKAAFRQVENSPVKNKI